jgi:hypothetical protein
MDSKEIRSLMESYNAIYQEDNGIDLDLDLTGIEDISDEEIDAIVEETIAEMLEEGYDFDEVEEIFEEVILEMNPYAPAGSKAAKQYAKSTTASKRGAERAAKINKLKDTVKSAFGRARDAVKSGVAKAKEAGREAKFQAVDKKVAAYATKRGIAAGAGLSARSKDPEKRRGLRAKVAADIGQRIKAKVGRGIEKAKTAKAGVASAAASAPGAVNSAVRRGIGGAARALSRGARNVARKLGEDFDVYDIILEHLLDEGYASTEEAATVIMANMSEEWREEILEMHPAELERIAQRAAGKVKVTSVKPKKKPAKNKAGMQ